MARVHCHALDRVRLVQELGEELALSLLLFLSSFLRIIAAAHFQDYLVIAALESQWELGESCNE